MRPAYFHYWGKARKADGQSGDDYHLLPYHCLDVAAVAAYWWDNSPSLQRAFTSTTDVDVDKMRAWVLFFIALHDLGKFDLRFQCKSLHTWLVLHPEDRDTSLPSVAVCKGFDHGKAGLFWFINDFQDGSAGDVGDLSALLLSVSEHPYQTWLPWLEAVTGHHGFVVEESQVPDHSMPFQYQALAGRDKTARSEWIDALERLFLGPAGLSIADVPPEPSTLLAGFCSVSDWLGSWLADDTFQYRADVAENDEGLKEYFDEKYGQDATRVVTRSGLLGQLNPYGGMEALLDSGCKPRQLQVLVPQLPLKQGLTLIEAPTGSGKTETALAHAWHLLDQGLADSIIFALPTQATANAMLSRLNKLADTLFEHPNLILAHGFARFNEEFQAIRQRGVNAQGDTEAWAQCCEWLSQSRKRVFLGQIGVCTIDQVLISVLPVRHRFVRGFGIGRSVLIVDEVHAYDTYMYGLLEAVLTDQQRAGGSAILLSATLPDSHKQKLLKTYGDANEVLPEHYPLIAWRAANDDAYFDLHNQPEHRPTPFSVQLEALRLLDLQPDDALLKRMVDAARAGAQVCFICNLVDVAQSAYRALQHYTDIDVILFHARFTLVDRKTKEERVLNCFGKDGDRTQGRILIATQVVEQSLDVDFDWLITQLCPVDLLFQRIGRLHRHALANRPAGFEQPVATVLLPDGEGYATHSAIYPNTLVMWRTQRRMEALGDSALNFPDAYRQWIEPIYKPELKGDEPEWVITGYDKFESEESIKRGKARSMLKWAKDAALNDDDENVRAVTRDGEMSLPVLPYRQTAQGRQLLDGRVFELLPEREQWEALALNRVNVPHSWENLFIQELDSEYGVIWLSGSSDNDGYLFEGRKMTFIYTKEKGMEKLL